MDVGLSLIESIPFSVVLVKDRPSVVAVFQGRVREDGVEVLLSVDAFAVVLAVPERPSVLITIDVANHSEYKMPVENAHFCGLRRVSDSLPLPSACLKLSLVYLMLENLSAVEVLESESKLSDVLGGIGDKHAIPVQHVVLPLSDVFDAMAILLLDSFEVLVLSFELAWNFLELVV